MFKPGQLVRLEKEYRNSGYLYSTLTNDIGIVRAKSFMNCCIVYWIFQNREFYMPDKSIILLEKENER